MRNCENLIFNEESLASVLLSCLQYIKQLWNPYDKKMGNYGKNK